MTRKEAKKQLEKAKLKQRELAEFLVNTCKHRTKKHEQTSDSWDYFKHYRTYCADCNKTLSES